MEAGGRIGKLGWIGKIKKMSFKARVELVASNSKRGREEHLIKRWKHRM